MHRRIAALLAALSALVALLLAAGPVLAAPELAITPASGRPGDSLTAIAVGFAPGTAITLLWNAQPDAVVATGTADASGQAVVTFQIPLDETAGAAVVRACAGADGCAPDAEFADATIDVLPAPLGGGDPLGSSVALFLIAMLTLGLGYLTVARLRRTQTTFKPQPRVVHEGEHEDAAEIIEERRREEGR
jgi:hypothetical protein